MLEEKSKNNGLDFCMSSYLSFRYVPKTMEWRKGVISKQFKIKEQKKDLVKDFLEVSNAVEKNIENLLKNNKVGILLSGGMDSIILASYLPENTPAYTIKCLGDGIIDEAPDAKMYAEKCGLKHKIVDVSWDDYDKNSDLLMLNKGSPLHPMEPSLFKVASVAKADGVDVLIGGWGSAKFGEKGRLLEKDWRTIAEMIKLWRFVDPTLILKDPVSMREIFKKYAINGVISTYYFFMIFYGTETNGAFLNPIYSAGCDIRNPYQELELNITIDFDRVRGGDDKYIIAQLFHHRYPGLECPRKVALQRPMDAWMKQWKGPKRSEFLDYLDIGRFNGEQKWLIYCLERFLNLIENE